MFKRLGNLWKLSEFSVEESNNPNKDPKLTRDIDQKPRGMATIVNMDDPLDQFESNDKEI